VQKVVSEANDAKKVPKVPIEGQPQDPSEQELN